MPSFRFWFRSNPQSLIPAVQGQLLNNAPPVPNAFIGAPVSPRVPPRGRALVPTLDRDYYDGARHLLTCRASRMAPASGFHPGRDSKVPECTHATASRFDHQDTAGPGNGLPDLHFAPAVSLGTWVLSPVELFADLRSLRPRVPRFQDFSRIAYPLTGDTDALGCGTGSTLSSRPRVGLAPTFVCGQGDSGRPETRFRVAQSRLWKAPDWVESGVVSPGSARCNRTSPITGIRLRAMRLVTVGSGHEKDVYRSSGCVGAHPCLRKIWRQ